VETATWELGDPGEEHDHRGREHDVVRDDSSPDIDRSEYHEHDGDERRDRRSDTDGVAGEREGPEANAEPSDRRTRWH
jgi:hypothetical protein